MSQTLNLQPNVESGKLDKWEYCKYPVPGGFLNRKLVVTDSMTFSSS